MTPVRPEPGVTADGRAQRAPPSGSSAIVDALDRPLDKAAAGSDAGPLDVPADLQHDAGRISRRWCARAKEYIAAGDIFQVVLSQRFEAPFALPPFSLYRALRRVNPSPFLLFPRLRRLRGRRLEPGNPGARARRHRHDPPDRRHAAARRDAARGQGARGRAARRSEGARRAPDAARSRPQRRRPRRRDRHASRSPTSSSSSATAT